MAKLKIISVAILLAMFQQCVDKPQEAVQSSIAIKVDSILNKMSLSAKVGQLNQLRGTKMIENNHSNIELDVFEEVKAGRVGTMLNVWSLEDKIKLQKVAVEESPNKLPLIFAMDVVHGFGTTFPVPLAEAASWDMSLIKKSAEIAALEASALGIMWTFAPMVDVGFDARWGRTMEGAGEDPFLGSLIAKTRVRGFQGDDLSLPHTIMATAKHFAGYGQVEAGREYNQTTISKRYLHEYVLPPFEAASKAGAAAFMNAFNDFNGIPASGNKYLITDILKDRWGFEGVVVSDWDSFGEMVEWGYAKDDQHAAELAINAGSDIDMMSLVYLNHLEKLVQEGEVDERKIDEAVRRVLSMKYKLGLFDNPYKYFTEGLFDSLSYAPAHREHARKIATESMVLLKNEKQLLPLEAGLYKKIAVIGPSDSDPSTHMATWSAAGNPDSVITITQGIQNYLGEKASVLFAAGCKNEQTRDQLALNKAIALAKKSDLIILTLGEGRWFSGENTSLTDINIPDAQIELAKAIYKLNKPTVCILVNGRPMLFPWLTANAPAILEAWAAGCEAGTAVADILFGTYNPSGKLPITFPSNVGQVPISYITKSTGRPYPDGSHYKDAPNTPAYPFGHGLSYTQFEYSDIQLNKTQFEKGDSIVASVLLKNTGLYDGQETVQLYLKDWTGTVTRPLMQLKRFQKIKLKKGESQVVSFSITEDILRYWDADMEYKSDPGMFSVMIGTSSAQFKKTDFELINDN